MNLSVSALFYLSIFNNDMFSVMILATLNALLQCVSYLFDAIDQLFVPSAFALFDAYFASIYILMT